MQQKRRSLGGPHSLQREQQGEGELAGAIGSRIIAKRVSAGDRNLVRAIEPA
jgi:hypothetical protein